MVKAKDKCRLRKDNNKVFIMPTIQEIKAYCDERKNAVIADKWLAHYEANGWKVGKNPMKDWKAAVRTWEHSEYNQAPLKSNPKPPIGLSNVVRDDRFNPWANDPDGVLK
jgi:hypothetical protein